MTKPTPTFSFEFFPTRSTQAAQQLDNAARMLDTLKPTFMTVTYGAGGSAQNGTIDTVTRLSAQSKTDLAVHLTFITSTKEELEFFTDRVWEQGIRHIVALRGDVPAGVQWPNNDGMHFAYTSDFVAWLKGRYDFQISVGAYPEKHPDAPSLKADIAALKMKCDAGADRAITQFFFDNDVYFRFVDEAQKQGVSTPIVPGVLPVLNFSKMMHFAQKCGTTVPDDVVALFEKYPDGSPDALKCGEEFLLRQCDNLLKRGAGHIHFYTLNHDQPITRVCKALTPPRP